jgi:hypothetical protein
VKIATTSPSPAPTSPSISTAYTATSTHMHNIHTHFLLMLQNLSVYIKFKHWNVGGRGGSSARDTKGPSQQLLLLLLLLLLFLLLIQLLVHTCITYIHTSSVSFSLSRCLSVASTVLIFYFLLMLQNLSVYIK